MATRPYPTETALNEEGAQALDELLLDYPIASLVRHMGLWLGYPRSSSEECEAAEVLFAAANRIEGLFEC